MPPSVLESRRAFLLKSQNADGGWGYFAGKHSWLEPTVYAILALEGDAQAKDAVDRAWKLLRSWQRPDGAWRPAAAVNDAHWGTALMLTLHCVRETFDEPFERGLRWLLQTEGAEGGFIARVSHWLNTSPVEQDPGLRGWPWRTGTSSWVEPTAHALVALKKCATRIKDGAVRIRNAERMLIERRCTDGGWNYGNRRVLGVDLHSFPETTALALLGLQASQTGPLQPSLDRARRHWDEAHSPLALAWLAIALQNHGAKLEPGEIAGRMPEDASGDVMLTSLQALASPQGNHKLLRTSVVL